MLAFNQPALDLSEFAVAGRNAGLVRRVRLVGPRSLPSGRDAADLRAAARLRRPAAPRRAAAVPQPQAAGRQGFHRIAAAARRAAATSNGGRRCRPKRRPAAGRSNSAPPGRGDVVQGMTLRVEEFLPERMKLDIDSPQATIRPARSSSSRSMRPTCMARRPRATASPRARPRGRAASGRDSFPSISSATRRSACRRSRRGRDRHRARRQRPPALAIALPAEATRGAPVAAIVTGSVFESGGRPVNRSMKRVYWPAGAWSACVRCSTTRIGAVNSNVGFELVRSNLDGKLHAGKGLTRHAGARGTRLPLDLRPMTHWGYDYSSRWKTIETERVSMRAPKARAVRFPGGVGRLPGRGEGSRDRPDHALPVRRRLGLGQPEPRPRRASRQDQAGAGQDPLPRRRQAQGHGDAAARRRRASCWSRPTACCTCSTIDAKAGARIELTVTPDWERHDVYITALVFRGGSAVEKITPARALGVVHVPMDRRDRRVAVAVARAEADATGAASAGGGEGAAAGRQARWVTISAVDLGILNITRFPVPDAAAHFFAQRRLGVDAYDIYGRVIESFEGETARCASAATWRWRPCRRRAGRPRACRRWTCSPARCCWTPRAKARLSVTVPDFNGTLRVSALVYRADKLRPGQQRKHPARADPGRGQRAARAGARRPQHADAGPAELHRQAGEFEVSVDASGPIADRRRPRARSRWRRRRRRRCPSS